MAGAEAAPGAPLTHGGRRSGAARTPGALTLSEDDRRVLAGWAADCAQQALPLLETHAPDDMRPRDAIAGARAFARGELRIGPARARAAGAHAAARDVHDPAAVAAARAAGHAAAVAHMAAHALGAPAYAAKAAGSAVPDDPEAARRVVEWAEEHASPQSAPSCAGYRPDAGPVGRSAP